MAYENITIEREGSIATITVNRPKSLNALNSLTLRELMVASGGAEPPDARAYLSATAAEVARRLSFLEEPLAVWELDGGERVCLGSDSNDCIPAREHRNHTRDEAEQRRLACRV